MEKRREDEHEKGARTEGRNTSPASYLERGGRIEKTGNETSEKFRKFRGSERAEKSHDDERSRNTGTSGKSRGMGAAGERKGQRDLRDRRGQRARDDRSDESAKKDQPGRSVRAGQKNPEALRLCPVADKCGGCDLLGMSYPDQLQRKDRYLKKLLGDLVAVIHPILGMENPLHYRCKVNAAFDHDRKGNPISGIYEKNSHRLVPVDSCLIEDETCSRIIVAVRSLLRSFKIRTYDEDSGFGYLRHVSVRKGYATGQYMVVLVVTSPIFPGKNNFVKALCKEVPEVTTVVLNINDRDTSMVLGERNIPIYGKGFIEDEICGFRFRISPGSFYQVNPPQAELLYRTAIRYAGLSGKEQVLDCYCGTGTIGIAASPKAKFVIGVESDQEAVRDAIRNAASNGIRNITFIQEDAGIYLRALAEEQEEKGDRESSGDGDQNWDRDRDAEDGSSIFRPDVCILDPPRSGSTEEFIDSLTALSPRKVVYVSCGPDSLARDLKVFQDRGYQAVEAQPVDLFPYTDHIETIVLLQKLNS